MKSRNCFLSTIACSLAVLASPQAFADATTLFEDCKVFLKVLDDESYNPTLSDAMAGGKCSGYVDALRDSFAATSSKDMCIPESAQNGDLIRTLVSEGTKHPRVLTFPKIVFAVSSLQEIYPCK